MQNDVSKGMAILIVAEAMKRYWHKLKKGFHSTIVEGPKGAVMYFAAFET